MTEDELLTDFMEEFDCPDESREFIRGTKAFKRYKITGEWESVLEDLYSELPKFFNATVSISSKSKEWSKRYP